MIISNPWPGPTVIPSLHLYLVWWISTVGQVTTLSLKLLMPPPRRCLHQLFLLYSFSFLVSLLSPFISSIFKCWRWLRAEPSFLFNLLSPPGGNFIQTSGFKFCLYPSWHPVYISKWDFFPPWNWGSLLPASYLASSLGCLIVAWHLPSPK